MDKRITYVHPTGPIDAKIALVGEQPGKSEIWYRPRPTPFVGPAGRELDSCLCAAGISRHECYLTNVIKDLDHPIEYYIDLAKKPPRVSPDGQEYIDLLKEELEKCSANVIVAIGSIALFALCSRVGITKWRGSILESTILTNRKVIGTLHPATIIPPKNQYLNRHLIVFDLKRAETQSTTPDVSLKSREISLRPTFYDAMGFLTECITKGLKGDIIDYDIELFNEEVACISFAISPTRAICIPFIDSGGDYFTLEQEAEVWVKIASILENPKIRKRGQNLAFDAHFLLRRYGIRAQSLYDTMVAQKILFPDYPVGLHFITTMYTDIPYYKDDGKRWFKTGGAWERLWNYNALDAISCAEAGPPQVRDLERQGNIATYERQRKLIPPLVYMMERGIRVDVEGMRKEGEECGEEIERLQGELDTVVGRALNPNSPKQLIQYFYVEKGYTPYRKRGGGLTTDDDALKRLARKGAKEATIIREMRELVKLKSNYLNVDKVDKDNRIRCSYNPVGTKFSRVSSSENIFGTGMNMQNWPHKALKYLLADEGYMLYTVDESQIESRIAAHVGNIRPMIDAFENGMDIHILTAALVFGKPYDEISDEEGSSPLAGGRFSERFWGKKTNYGFIYGQGYRQWALQMELPETEAKWIHGRYHAAYPEVRQKYHTMIKAQLAENRTITNLFDRRTLFLDKWDDKLFRAGYSCMPQGTTGDKINEQGLNYIYYDQESFAPVELLVQVHDSIGFQIPLSTPWLDHAEILIKIKRSLETPLVWKEREFVVPVDFTIGFNFYKEGDLCIGLKHKDMPTSTEKLAELLEQNHNKLCKVKENKNES